jgi:thioredoxin-related protein
LPLNFLLTLFFGLLLWLSPALQAAQDGEPSFDDQPLAEPLTHPDWFKLSFLDLKEDIQEAGKTGKQGLILYFGQKYCAYCKALLERNFGKPDIRSYTRQHFDVIGIDIHGDRSVTDLQGQEWTERSFSTHLGTVFTPTLLFYDTEGQEALRLPGYYPPYTFRAALEYVAGGHYRQEDFRSYLARAEVPLVFETGGLNHQDFFAPPPHALDRSRWPATRPLVVFFEQGDCHACDILHTGPLAQASIRERLRRMETVQLDLWGNTPVITPAGKRTTDGDWAAELGLFYAPTLLFFDEQGREIIRVDSVTQIYRLQSVLDYVLSGDYLEQPDYQQWRGRH